MQNCGVSHVPLDFKDQYFGCEIEMTGLSRATAAHALADLFGTRSEHSGGGYDAYRVLDSDGKEWKIVRDSSITPQIRRRSNIGYPPGILMQNHSFKTSLPARICNIFAVQPEKLTP